MYYNYLQQNSITYSYFILEEMIMIWSLLSVFADIFIRVRCVIIKYEVRQVAITLITASELHETVKLRSRYSAVAAAAASSEIMIIRAWKSTTELTAIADDYASKKCVSFSTNAT
jgi:hypothetical protein